MAQNFREEGDSPTTRSDNFCDIRITSDYLKKSRNYQKSDFCRSQTGLLLI